MLTLGKIPPFICAWEGFQLQILNEVQGILDLFEIFECLQILDLQSVEKVTRAFRFVFDFSENLYVEFPGGGGTLFPRFSPRRCRRFLGIPKLRATAR